MPLKFKKNESFYIRDGWFEKAIISTKEEKKNIFYKDEGIEILGIGSNMVKGLKYWLQASNIINPKSSMNDLTQFGELLYKYDPYLDSKFSWFLIHYKLATNLDECPLFYLFFNSPVKTLPKSSIFGFMMERVSSIDSTAKKDYVEKDLNVFLKSYLQENADLDPEENYVCPLSELNLLKKDGSDYFKTRPQYSSLSYLIVYFALTCLYGGKPFAIEDAIEAPCSPVLVFNLDKTMFTQYLDEMRHSGLVTINKTAGLNTVYFNEKILNLPEIFERNFEGEKHV